MKRTYRFLSVAAAIMAVFACSEKPGTDDNPKAEEITLPSDPAPARTDFQKKLLITDFTGTDCPYCPTMTKVLRIVMGNAAYQKSTILTVAHTYNEDDPAYLASNLDSYMGVNKYPTLIFDMNKDWSMGYTDSFDADMLQTQIDVQIRRNPAIAGICAASSVKDGTVTVKAGIKSGADAATDYYVAVMILEDGIEGTQHSAPDPSYNIHDDCIRMIEGCNGKNFAGTRLENVLKKGETGEITFAFKLDPEIVQSNCRYVAYVSCADEKGDFKVVNAVSAALGESVKYQYK